MTKAENQCISVAAASIISRYIFLREVNQLSKKYKTTILLGASDKVDQLGAELVRKYGIEVLEDVAKMNFKNTEKIKNIIRDTNA